MKNEKMNRRRFIGTTTLGAAALALGVRGNFCRADELRKYEPNLRDRLWMWGHGPGTTDGICNIPAGNKIDMADAIDSMGIPNVCVIRWMGKPEPPFDEYIKQFHKTKRVAWSVVDGAPQDYVQKKQWAFELSETMPNLVNFFLDDYFVGNAVPDEGREDSPACLTLSQIRDLRKEMASLKRPTDLSVVLYSNQLQPGIKRHIEPCDVVSFWTWHATDLVALQDNFKRYREIVPDKPTLLGVYMWDFGNAKPITMELMKLQLEFALEQLKQGQIEGLIFHCTPLCDIGLEAVTYSRKWIDKHGDLIVR
ncbi:MAG: twin-arginine translocation signal domain-containing protein [Planctomycetaceae bacterium]|nr:twin-arginine translocation signal domain-containing protein [Planctomycetaceae bacterium]